jgi:hypothetical protein
LVPPLVGAVLTALAAAEEDDFRLQGRYMDVTKHFKMTE